jgi:PiT family inorganic phosphate transporter
VQVLVGVLFFAGTIFGLGRLGGRLGSKLLPVHEANSIAAGYAAAVAVLGSAALGSPVSMAQSATTGLVAATIATDGPLVVRWQQAGRIGLTWLLTLPIALLVAMTAGLISRTF